ncbi:acyl-CoA/acyl-ACP dehydrogenase [Mycolicibacterium sp. BiH015]|uniref:acyl-CoA dehydrogenase family protein n=1 Tax=Mycolicibacterium sp. BiH015 TaxID=3018808 RepID=UPI0022E2516D|nr:acyl-CoA dehydrogenase family protein [Mycolicibacterium sp. BiH015]MDA2889325.1 acyl-CoA/acyl-ACP dehydrogenase [Mycolicibacterium sp. BiH015]
MSTFTEFHDELCSVANDLLAKDREIDWSVLVHAGWTGLEVPESAGGAGATFTETALILRQIGRAAGANHYLGSAALAVAALQHAPDELLAAVADGSSRFAVVTDQFDAASGKVTGRAEFVPDAVDADRLLILVDGGVAVVPASAVTVSAQPVVDETRALATVSADGAVPEVIVPSDCASAVVDRATVAIAVDSLGIAEQMLESTVDYVKMRHQFGRPIGSFQAVKHACADMLVAIEVSRQLVADAVAAVGDGADATVPAAMAKSHTCSAAVHIAGKAMQLHGGIGYTWESGIHTYLKRATLNRSLFGSPAMQRKRLSQRYH